MPRKEVGVSMKGLTPEEIDEIEHHILRNTVARKQIDPKPFGLLLKRLRQEKGFSIREVEKETAISASYLYQLERGDRNLPSVNIILILSRLYEAPFGPLLDAAEHMNVQATSVYHQQLNQAFHYICQDKRFQFNSLVDEAAAPDDVKRFVIEVYEHFTGLKLLEEANVSKTSNVRRRRKSRGEVMESGEPADTKS